MASECAKLDFFIGLDIFQTDDKDIAANDIYEKIGQIFKMDDASVCHSPNFVSFLDDSPVRHPRGKVLSVL